MNIIIDFPTMLDLSRCYSILDMSNYEFLEITKYGINLHKDNQHTFKDIQLALKSDSWVIIILDDEDVKNRIISMSLFRVR